MFFSVLENLSQHNIKSKCVWRQFDRLFFFILKIYTVLHFLAKRISAAVRSWFLLEIICSLLTPCSLIYFQISGCLCLSCYPDSFHLARSNIKGSSKCYGALLLLLSFAVKTFFGGWVFTALLFYFLLVYFFISEW